MRCGVWQKGAGRHELMGLFDAIETHYDDFKKQNEKVLAEINSTDFMYISDSGIHPLIGAANVPIEKIDKLISDIRKEALIDKERFAAATISKVKKLNTFAICVAFVACGLGIAIGFFISVNISRPMTRAVKFASQMSRGTVIGHRRNVTKYQPCLPRHSRGECQCE